MIGQSSPAPGAPVSPDRQSSAWSSTIPSLRAGGGDGHAGEAAGAGATGEHGLERRDEVEELFRAIGVAVREQDRAQAGVAPLGQQGHVGGEPPFDRLAQDEDVHVGAARGLLAGAEAAEAQHVHPFGREGPRDPGAESRILLENHHLQSALPFWRRGNHPSSA